MTALLHGDLHAAQRMDGRFDVAADGTPTLLLNACGATATAGNGPLATEGAPSASKFLPTEMYPTVPGAYLKTASGWQALPRNPVTTARAAKKVLETGARWL